MQGKIIGLELKLLGRPAIALHQEPLTNFVSEKAISLLCYLIADQKMHARHTLAALFWGNLTEERAKANLRQALHNINTLCPGYFDINRKTVQFLNQQPHWLDLDRFSELIQSAEIEQLQKGVSLYRDQFMHGLSPSHSPEFEQWIGSMSEFYHQKQIGGLQTLINHFIGQEAWSVAAQFLSQLLHLEPWNETGHRQLTRCYAYQRQFDKALQQIEKCRDLLWHHLEVDVTSETLDLAQRIHQARQAPQLNIRPPDAPFVGRKSERELLHAHLKSRQIITIAGLGGLGKTRLAMQVGLENKNRFLNGVLFVSLAHISPALDGHTAIAEGILQAGISSGQYNPTPHENASSFNRCLKFLHHQELLLILDNFEHLNSHADFVARLAEQLPDLTLLVTSRQLLNLRHETVMRLDGLNTADELSDSASLFRQFAKQSGANLTETDEGSILEICRLVDGHPLAIELAADLTPFQSCAQIAHQLEQRLDTLSSSQGDMVARQKSMSAIFEASWDASTKEEQIALTKLSWFFGTFSPEAALQIAQADPQILQRLGRKSLVNFQDGRYSIHPLLRQFLITKLPHLELSFENLAATAAAYYLNLLADLGDQASRFGPARVEQRLRADLDNFVAGWHWATEHNIHALTPIIHHMQSLMSDRGIHHLAHNLVKLALPVALKTTNQSLIHGLKLQHLYHLFWDGKQHADVITLIREIEQEIDPAAQSPEHAYYQLIAGWYNQYQLGEMGPAAEHYRKSKDIYATLGFHKQAAGRWLDLGNIAYSQGDLDEAERVWLAGLRLCQQHTIPLGNAILKFSLSQVELKRNNWVSAEAYLLEAQQMSQLHNGLEHAILGGLGEIAVFNKEYNQAQIHFQAQLDSVNKQGQLFEFVAAHCNLGRLFLTQNLPDQAQHHFRQAQHLAKMYQNTAVLNQIDLEIKKGAF